MPRNQGALSRLAELMRRVNSSTDTADVLEEIAGGVVDVLGYGVAAIARLEGDTLVMTNVVGPPEVVAQILHRRTPADQILDEFRKADKWGILRFVPAGRMSDERLRAAWVPDFEPDDDPGAWHPQHALYAPLYSADGELLGNMAVDLPPDRRIPTAPDRELLEMFAVQAGVALSNARERERLTERVRLDRMLKAVAAAGTQLSLSEALEHVRRGGGRVPASGPGVGALLPQRGSRRRAHGRHAPTAAARPGHPRAPARPDSSGCLAPADPAGCRRPLVPGAARESRDAPGGHGLARRRPRGRRPGHVAR